MADATCLYCETTKPIAEFNREHVLPQSFGRFENNLVLVNLVCTECNSYFANKLELQLGRGSFEGIDRFRLGIAAKNKARNGRNLSTIEARRDGGPHDGAIFEWRISDGKVVPVPQIGVSKTEVGPFTWYRLTECPTGDELRAQGFANGATCFQVAGLSLEEAVKALTDLGYEPQTAPVVMPTDVGQDGKIDLKIAGTIDRVLLRAVAKISFNYLAYFYPAIASMDQFRPIRRFVRFDETPSFAPVTISQNSVLAGVPQDRQVLVHVATAQWRGTAGLVGQISLFSWVQYVVQLAGPEFLVPPLCVDSGTAFDPFGGKMYPLTRDIALSLREIPMVKYARKA